MLTVGGFNEATVTDDLDLSFRFLLAGLPIGLLWNPPVQEEAVLTLPALWRQRQRWADAGLDSFVADEAGPMGEVGELAPGQVGVSTSVPGNVWKILVAEGAQVEPGQPVAIIESMKMEITVTAHAGGSVREVRAAPGRNVRSGEVLLVLDPL